MLESLLKFAVDPGAEQHLRRQIDLHKTAVLASAGRGAVADVADAEQAARADPGGAFTFDRDGRATLTTDRRTWDAGRFELLSIGELRRRASMTHVPGTEARLWILEGMSPVTDIGSLQATTSDALFQVASQFNCLESPGPYVTPVSDYFLDSTQGPRAAISAFPGTLLRHYAAPDMHSGRFVQATDARQINLLSAISGPHLPRVQNGYLNAAHVTDPRTLATALESQFDAIQVGVHADVQVALGYDWDGRVEDSERRRIAQVYTSTLAGGASPILAPVCRQLLRAAYLGTLLATAILGRKRAVLTLIGGGVFGNPVALIWEAIFWALNEAKPFLAYDLDVIVNSRTPVPREETLEPLRGRYEAWLAFTRDGGLEIIR
ncbi:MAG: hypothetical protein R3B70_35575 [Polyangiaceae bacterium]